MSKYVDLENSAYSTYLQLTSPEEYARAPPSFLNGYHSTTEDTWQQPKKVPDAIQDRKSTEDLYMRPAGTKQQRKDQSRARAQRMQTSSINMGEDETIYRTTSLMPDHTPEVFLRDALRRARKIRGVDYDPHLTLTKSSISLGLDEEADNINRYISTAKTQVYSGSDQEALKAAANAKKKKVALQSTSVGMSLGLDSVSYETESKRGQDRVLRHKKAQETRPNSLQKDRHIRSTVGDLLRHE